MLSVGRVIRHIRRFPWVSDWNDLFRTSVPIHGSHVNISFEGLQISDVTLNLQWIHGHQTKVWRQRSEVTTACSKVFTRMDGWLDGGTDGWMDSSLSYKSCHVLTRLQIHEIQAMCYITQDETALTFNVGRQWWQLHVLEVWCAAMSI